MQCFLQPQARQFATKAGRALLYWRLPRVVAALDGRRCVSGITGDCIRCLQTAARAAREAIPIHAADQRYRKHGYG